MNRPIVAVATISLVFVALPVDQSKAHQGQDAPPLRFAVDLDGKQYDAIEGREFEVSLGDSKVSATIRVLPTRRFDAAGVAFDYPRHMSYEYEADIGIEMWTLVGNSCTLMLQRYIAGDAEGLAGIVLREGAAAIGQRIKQLEATTVMLGGTRVKAQRASIVIDDITQTWTIFGFEHEGKPLVVWLRDMVEDNGAMTEEMKRLLDHLARTFKRD